MAQQTFTPAQAIAYSTRASGGGTFTREGTTARMSIGYMVGGVPGATVHTVPADDIAAIEIAAAAVLAELDTLARDGRTTELYIGTWQDGDTVYVEASERVHTLTYAVAVARQRGELAVWDLHAGRELRIGPAGIGSEL